MSIPVDEPLRSKFIIMGKAVYTYALFNIFSLIASIGLSFSEIGVLSDLIITIALILGDLIIFSFIITKSKLIVEFHIHPNYENYYTKLKLGFVLVVIGKLLYLILSFIMMDAWIQWITNPEWLYSEWFLAYLPDIISGIFLVIGYIIWKDAWVNLANFFGIADDLFSRSDCMNAADASRKLSTLAKLSIAEIVIDLVYSAIPLIILEIMLASLAISIAILVLSIWGYFKLGNTLRSIHEPQVTPYSPTYNQTYQNTLSSNRGQNFSPLSYSPKTEYNSEEESNPNIDTSKGAIFCPRCGMRNMDNSRYCSNCGFDFNSLKQ